MPRRATTLIEVLIAIFVMALGLISLLTLYPLGAAQMARSVQDERAAQLAANAGSYMRWYWKNMCEQAIATKASGKALYEVGAANETNMQSMLWFPYAMDDPQAGAAATALGSTPPINMPGWPGRANTMADAQKNSSVMSRQTRASSPVFVDPVGWQASGGQPMSRIWIGGQPTATATSANPIQAIPRRSMCDYGWSATHQTTGALWAPMNSRNISRTFFMLDDMGFGDNGGALTAERVGQYSFACMLRRDSNSNRTETNMTIAVYFRRSMESLSEEPTFDGSLLSDPSLSPVSTITLHYPKAGGDPNNARKPPIRRGSWILDATMVNKFSNTASPQGFYYRVVDVSEPRLLGPEYGVDVQLETPIRPGPSGLRARLIVVPDRLLEVFDKGPIDMMSSPRVN